VGVQIPPPALKAAPSPQGGPPTPQPSLSSLAQLRPSRTVRSQSKQRVGGHQAEQLVESVSVSQVAGPPLLTYVLWNIDGTDVYMISTTLLNVPSPKPAQASLTLKLIARVSHLR
jgi:hypothetical protein